MATVLRASMADILPLVEARVESVTGLQPEQVRLVLRSKGVPMSQDRDILLRPGGLTNRREESFGAGRVATVLDRRLYVYVRTNLSVDDPGEDTKAILHSTLGHVLLEEKVFDALIDFIPTDTSGNWLVTEPMELMSGEDLDKDASGSGVAQGVYAFRISYMPPLDQGVQ